MANGSVICLVAEGLILDTVFIEALEIETVIGIYDWEREVKQTVVLDIEMAHDITQAAITDNIVFTLNYHAVANRLLEFVGGSEFLLVETMAERCAEIVRSEFAVPWLRLKVSKPGAVREARAVGVVIERGERY